MNPTFQERLFPILLAGWRWIEKNSAILVLVLALITFVSAFAGVSIPTSSRSAQTSEGVAPEATNGTELGPIMSMFNWVTNKIYESAPGDVSEHGAP